MEKNITCEHCHKKLYEIWSVILVSDKVDFKVKNIIKGRDGDQNDKRINSSGKHNNTR